MSEQPNNEQKSLYGEDWVPTPDDPNYGAYLKYQENLANLQGNAAPAKQQPKPISFWQRPEAESTPQPAAAAPETSAEEAPGQVAPAAPAAQGVSEESQSVTTDTAGSMGAGTVANSAATATEESFATADPTTADPAATTGATVPDPAAAAGTAAEPAAESEGAYQHPKGAWVPTDDPAQPWAWDAEAIPNQSIGGKPVCVPQGAWVATGDPINPWRWDPTALPDSYLEGKPVYNGIEDQSPYGTPMGGPQGFPDLSSETGEDRPDVPMSSRIIWFLVGAFAGFFGWAMAWFVASRYPQRQRKQVTNAAWLGVVVWALIMLGMMYGGGDIAGMLGMSGAEQPPASSGSGAFN